METHIPKSARLNKAKQTILKKKVTVDILQPHLHRCQEEPLPLLPKLSNDPPPVLKLPEHEVKQLDHDAPQAMHALQPHYVNSYEVLEHGLLPHHTRPPEIRESILHKQLQASISHHADNWQNHVYEELVPCPQHKEPEVQHGEQHHATHPHQQAPRLLVHNQPESHLLKVRNGLQKQGALLHARPPDHVVIKPKQEQHLQKKKRVRFNLKTKGYGKEDSTCSLEPFELETLLAEENDIEEEKSLDASCPHKVCPRAPVGCLTLPSLLQHLADGVNLIVKQLLGDRPPDDRGAAGQLDPKICPGCGSLLPCSSRVTKL